MPRIIQEYKEEVRKKIVETAYHLFMTKGYRRATMDEIAGLLGVTKPALYQYFPGKEDLFAAVAERGRQELKGILERSYQERGIAAGSGELFNALVHYAPQFQGMYSEMLLLSSHNDMIRQILKDDLHKDIEVIELFISRQQEGGLISCRHNARTLALACHAMIGGLLLDISSGMEPEEAKKIWLSTVDILTRDVNTVLHGGK